MQTNLLNKDNYKKYSEERAKKSHIVKDTFLAFVIGGLICVFGQLLLELYRLIGLENDISKGLVSETLIFLTCFFTAIGWFDRLAKVAGAGTLVPITGFANAVISPALDSKAEGQITGLAAKMFIIAGPVIVYGTVASAIYGIIYYVCKLVF